MLKRITLENFFSFGEPTTIELNPGVNLLVGINGSGKSNFLKAIRLLHEAVAGKGFEKTFLQEWGGFANVAKILSTDSSGKSTPSFSGGGGVRGGVSAPSFNVVGTGGVNQLAQSLQAQDTPIRAYVVSGDVTSSQEFERNVENSSSIG